MPRPESIEFRAGEIDLAGTLVLPDEPPPEPRRRYPSVLLLASYFPRDRDGSLDSSGHPDWFVPPARDDAVGPLARIADALARHGVATLRYDKRGCGRSPGTWAEADWFTLVNDARDAVGYLRSRRDLDLARSGIVGHGEGAVIGLSVAIADPALGALTLIAPPARSFRDVLRRATAAWRRERQPSEHPFLAALERWSEDLIEHVDRREQLFELSSPSRGRAPLRLRLEGWHQAFGTPAVALVTMLHRSVGLVHGEADALVAPDESRLLHEALREAGNDPQLRLLPGVGHELAEATDADIEYIAADLAARLVPRPLPPVLLAIEQME